jgi:hypothetical protein
MRELTLNEICTVAGGLPQAPTPAASAPQEQLLKDCGMTPAEVVAACAPLTFGAGLAGGTIAAAAVGAVSANPAAAMGAFEYGTIAAGTVAANLCQDYMFNHCRF